MRLDLIQQIILPTLTLSDLARELRKALRNHPDPMKGEEAVGVLYGQVFRNKEKRYDAAGGRWLPVEEWS